MIHQLFVMSAVIMFFAVKCCRVLANIYAYIDPSAVTFTIQIAVGIVVAVGATVGIIITRLKKKAKDKLGIDFEKKKETEDELVILDDGFENTEEKSENE